MNEDAGNNFIQKLIEADVASGKHKGDVVTRFPPEPNGFLHIGHAKPIVLNFGLAKTFGGACSLRFDDTNPSKEDDIYVEAIKRDINWLGYDWGERLFHASDYFEQLYDWAVKLIKDSKAYVDSQTPEQIRENRGTLTRPGVESPYRNRTVEENLELFARMKAGEFAEGEHVLRAKIDMSSGNINFRDPVMYRILHSRHQRTGDKWHIYPMYDWAHGQSDALEGVTHSLCSIEFSDHNPLYEWFLDAVGVPKPRTAQTEFARLKITHTLLSKRKLIRLVEENHVSGWDDPRMPTLAGMRRRGYTPKAIRDFIERVGVDRRDSMVEYQLLEHFVRQDLNQTALRVMGVLDPLKVIITNYPEGEEEWLEAVNNPEDPTTGTRKIPFSRELYIDRADFMEDPPRKFFRLAPGREVRLMHGYYITCNDVVKDADGNVTELHCSYDPATKGGDSPDGRKVKGTLHWLSAKHAIDAQVRNYDHLFLSEDPNDVPEGQDFTDNINPASLTVMTGVKLEPSLATATPYSHYQLLRKGYFSIDPDSSADMLVLNQTIGLKDTWAKLQAKQKS
ncbi:MAG: glutamine--tRNA ligase/YqeY domain fusion protein [Deinococcota bacterium]